MKSNLSIFFYCKNFIIFLFIRCSKPKKPRKKSSKKKTMLIKGHAKVFSRHESCLSSDSLVPRNMGWLWNVEIPGVSLMRRGWKPGAVRKSVARIMKLYMNQPSEPDIITTNSHPPTLQVQKKNGEFSIVINPLNDETTCKEDISPIIFKLMKSEEVTKRSKARKILKTRGVVKTCNCSSIEQCDCLNTKEKSRIQCEMEMISKQLCLNPNLDLVDLKDTSDSEIDVEFSPPTAVRLESSLTKFAYAETQYETQENISKGIKPSQYSTKDDNNEKPKMENSAKNDPKSANMKKTVTKSSKKQSLKK
jgi:hypothetical protein